MGFAGFGRTPVPDTVTLEMARGAITVAVRVSPKARAYRLAVTARGEPVLTLPRTGRWREALAFLERNRGWLAARLEKTATPYSIAPEGRIPVRGVTHRIVSLSAPRGLVHAAPGPDGPQLRVPGGAEHLRRRLTDWLKAEARRDLEAACAGHAQTLDVQVAALRIRDQSSRWGSCSSARTLNFNWRLVLAPDFVLDYVAAHEVAHILEMNHRPAFWRTVGHALPDYGRGKTWLKANGAALMAI